MNDIFLKNGVVTYEAFGALGDGVTDDMPAICRAHEYANAHGISVRTEPAATYHLGSRALTAVIATDTDWNTSRFTVDDTQVENHKVSIFKVCSLLEPEEIQISRLTRDQKKVDVRPEKDCYVLIENSNRRRYIRRGLNQNNGAPQQDCFFLRRDGSVESPIDWDYDIITRIEARPIDDARLTLRGGIFTTFANRMKHETGSNYWNRNILISRSNTEVDGLTHYVVGETAVGQPYSGFLHVQQCANITLRNCFATGHKIYSTLGVTGKPVSMGSYDYNMSNVVDISIINCRMNHITDWTRWGVIASNYCKNILLEDCTLSRMDAHQGVSGTYTIRRCVIGHQGLNAIGRGLMTVEDSTLYCDVLVGFRGDYGSSWEGDLVIRNCRWIPACGERVWSQMFIVINDGMHDFGYPCYMPREITVDGLIIQDGNTPEDYDGIYIFSDPDNMHLGVENLAPSQERPFPYHLCRKVTLRRVTTASGKKLKLSVNAAISEGTVVIENDR